MITFSDRQSYHHTSSRQSVHGLTKSSITNGLGEVDQHYIGQSIDNSEFIGFFYVARSQNKSKKSRCDSNGRITEKIRMIKKTRWIMFFLETCEKRLNFCIEVKDIGF
jgi:hypothetical protein